MAGADYTALVEAVEEALTAGHPSGGTRVIAEADWFVLGLYPGEVDAGSSIYAREQKRVWVEVSEQQGRTDTQEIGTPHSYNIRMDLLLSYFSGHPDNHEELRDCHLIAMNDFPNIRDALCFGGNLSTNVAGTATGLSGGALIGSSGTWRKTLFNAEQRSIKALASFRGIIDLTAS